MIFASFPRLSLWGWGRKKLKMKATENNWRGGSLLVALCWVSWSLWGHSLGWEMLLCGGAAWPAVTRDLCSWLRLSVLVKLNTSLRVMWHSHIGFLLMSVLNHGDVYRTGPLTINIPPRGEITCNTRQASIFTQNPKIPGPAGSHFVGAHFSQAEGLGLLGGGQILRLLLCASPAVILGHTHVPWVMSLDLDYLPDRLPLEVKSDMKILHLWVIPSFISLSLQPMGLLSFSESCLIPRASSPVHLPRISFWSNFESLPMPFIHSTLREVGWPRAGSHILASERLCSTSVLPFSGWVNMSNLSTSIDLSFFIC